MSKMQVTYHPCDTCNAPYVQPRPEGWSYEVRRNPHSKHNYVTAHDEKCPEGYDKAADE